jgi:polysaccharide export outer membrane protein
MIKKSLLAILFTALTAGAAYAQDADTSSTTAVLVPSVEGPSAPPTETMTPPAGPDVDIVHPAPMLERRNTRYKIEIGDVIGLDFPFTPEYDENVTVQPDGYVSLITVGDMHVAGMTMPDLTVALRQTYAKILHNPIITVALSNFEQPYFIVGGEVGKPGKYDLHGDTTVVQAVEIAGGFTYTSKHSHVLLFRRISDDWISARVVNVKKMLNAGNLAEDLHIEPGDMVFVPKSKLSKVQPFLPYLLPYQLFRINFTASSAYGY